MVLEITSENHFLICKRWWKTVWSGVIWKDWMTIYCSLPLSEEIRGALIRMFGFLSFVPPVHTHKVKAFWNENMNVKNVTHIYRKTEQAQRRKIFAEHTIISDPESRPEMWLMKWDSTWESLVCFSYCYLVPQASSLVCRWSPDCRLAACLGSDQYSHSYLLPGLKSYFSIFAFLWLKLLS